MRALILAGAACVWDDAKTALEIMGEPDAVFAVNDMISLWPDRIDYACTLHAEKLKAWNRARKGNSNYYIWSHQNKPGVHRVRRDWRGSSSLFAVACAIDEGFDKIIVAGAPMEAKASHVVRRQVWASADAYRKGWVEHHKEIKDVVRSMSGWTMKQLGSPTPEWLGNERSLDT